MKKKKNDFFYLFIEGEVIKFLCLTGARVHIGGNLSKSNEYF